MGRIMCRSRRFLDIVFGLVLLAVPGVAFAQNQLALGACQDGLSSVSDQMESGFNSNYNDRLDPVYLCDSFTFTDAGLPRTGYGFRILFRRNASIQATSPTSYIPVAPVAGVVRVIKNASPANPLGSVHFYYQTVPDPEPDPCIGRPDFYSTTLRAPTPNGSGAVCHDGCAASVALGYTGTYPAGQVDFTFSYTGSICPPGLDEPTNASLPSDTPPLNLPPDEGGVGTVPDPGQGVGDDGRGSSSGGGDCSKPPACTGDSIQCNILFQSWSTRCAAERLDKESDSVGGLNCASAPSCSGDKIQCNILFQSWAARCETVAAIGESGQPGEPGEPVDLSPVTGALQGISDQLEGIFGDGTGLPDDFGNLPINDITIDSSSFNTSGLGLSRSCPASLVQPIFLVK